MTLYRLVWARIFIWGTLSLCLCKSFSLSLDPWDVVQLRTVRGLHPRHEGKGWFGRPCPLCSQCHLTSFPPLPPVCQHNHISPLGVDTPHAYTHTHTHTHTHAHIHTRTHKDNFVAPGTAAVYFSRTDSHGVIARHLTPHSFFLYFHLTFTHHRTSTHTHTAP
jgi:hypothetical protein